MFTADNGLVYDDLTVIMILQFMIYVSIVVLVLIVLLYNKSKNKLIDMTINEMNNQKETINREKYYIDNEFRLVNYSSSYISKPKLLPSGNRPYLQKVYKMSITSLKIGLH